MRASAEALCLDTARKLTPPLKTFYYKNMQKKKITIEILAQMVKRGFDEMGVRFERRFDFMEKRFDEVEKRLLRLETGFENLRIEVREIKYLLQQKASREELNELDSRLTRVEMRLKKAGV